MANKSTRTQHISNDRIQQWQAEIEAWKKILNTRLGKSVSIKISIADILHCNFDQLYLDEIEKFQTEFILEDEIIGLLRIEVSDLENLINRKSFEKIKLPQSLEETINHLRYDMVNSGKRFDSLFVEFEEFQQKICSEN